MDMDMPRASTTHLGQRRGRRETAAQMFLSKFCVRVGPERKVASCFVKAACLPASQLKVSTKPAGRQAGRRAGRAVGYGFGCCPPFVDSSDGQTADRPSVGTHVGFESATEKKKIARGKDLEMKKVIGFPSLD